ncbi:AMP-binding protein [Bradyrhizobium sp. AS23.2]|uniref:AMP-binding protein n=1 Tax=Bradyrhizobium sp. AS23.2 TaxID=1680155 RepID=UPI000B2EC648|nr:AMP-binding protein [Bradyrhizobium sp. AS23.2]
MYLTQSLRRSAQTRAGHLASVDGSERWTWSELLDRVGRMAGAFKHLGLRAGDRVAVLALNSARYKEVYYAAFWSGVVIVPLNTRWSLEELVYGVGDSEPRALYVDTEFLKFADPLKARCPSLEHIVLMDAAADKSAESTCLAYEDLIVQNKAEKPALVAGSDLAMICYTGGTTGRSKGVMLSQLSLWSSAMALTADRGLVGPKAVSLHVLPLFHIGGVQNVFATGIHGGMDVFHSAFEPKAFLGAISQHHVTHVVMVPTMIRMLLDQPDIAQYDLSSLKNLYYGAAPMSEAQIREAVQKLPGVEMQQGYGQTELSPHISTLWPEYHTPAGVEASRVRSAGQAGRCVEIIIADPTGNELSRGEVGEVRVRGPHMMLGYWRKPEETAATIVDGWIRTGDAGYMDEDGFVFLVDRLKDLIVSGGENVYSAEVENALASHPSVATGGRHRCA